jgi:hypothetical protein
LKYPHCHATASSGQDDGYGPSVLCSDPLDEAFGSEAIDEADCARVGQAQNGTQLRYRPAVEELMQGGECGGGRRAERRDRFDGCIHPVGDRETQCAQGVGCVLAA